MTAASLTWPVANDVKLPHSYWEMGFVNYYKVLGLEDEASIREISTAYRTLAMRYHPDKNAGNPEAVHQFHRIKEAYQVLTDATAKEALDAVLMGQKARLEREVSMSAARRVMRDDLLQRERQAKRRKEEGAAAAEAKLQKEMERLRRVAEEAEAGDRLARVKASIKPPARLFDDLDRTLKISLASKNTEARINEEGLRQKISAAMETDASIESIVIAKKGTSGLLRLMSAQIAHDVMSRFQDDTLLLSWAKGMAPVLAKDIPNDGASHMSTGDFESLVLMKLRQKAQERKQAQAKTQNTGEDGVEVASASAQELDD